MVALNNYVKDIQINTTKQHVNLYEEGKKKSFIHFDVYSSVYEAKHTIPADMGAV